MTTYYGEYWYFSVHVIKAIYSKTDQNQVVINKNIFELERQLGHGIESLTGYLFCDNEIIVGHVTIESAEVYNVHTLQDKITWDSNSGDRKFWEFENMGIFFKNPQISYPKLN